MSRIAPLSGFPEWSPEERVVERHVISELSDEFALHGFAEIATRAVEPLSRLTGDAEANKEVYALTRAADTGAAAELGLRFDLTVPFARYVEERQGSLQFPFRRYQVQPVWRGERPQAGRFREFCQADIDIVARGELPAHLEAEVAIVMARALGRLPLPGIRMRVNDRRLVEGFYRGVGIADVPAALRSVDKLAKITPIGVHAELAKQGIGDEARKAIIEFAEIRAFGPGPGPGPGPKSTPGLEVGLSPKGGTDWAERAETLWRESGATGDEARALFEAGLASLSTLVDAINGAVPGVAAADLSIARGLDYYTGAVYETTVMGHEDLGSICSGGRYDSLVAGGGFPGVGMSVGVSRLVSRLLSAGLATATRATPSMVLVAVADEESRSRSEDIAHRLRKRGVACEVAPQAAKFGKQIQYAERRGIPFVWFPGDGSDGEVKDIRSGEQRPEDVNTWKFPKEDASPRVVPGPQSGA